MNETVQITGYQLIYRDGHRDNVKLLVPVMIGDNVAIRLQEYRENIKERFDCMGVNLSLVMMG